MALRCKLKRNHITEVIIVMTPEIVLFIKRQRILSEEMPCLRRHGHVKHTLRVPLTCKQWLLPEHSEILVAGVQQSSIGVTLRVGEIYPQEEIGCSDNCSQKEEFTLTTVGACKCQETTALGNEGLNHVTVEHHALSRCEQKRDSETNCGGGRMWNHGSCQIDCYGSHRPPYPTFKLLVVSSFPPGKEAHGNNENFSLV